MWWGRAMPRRVSEMAEVTGMEGLELGVKLPLMADRSLGTP